MSGTVTVSRQDWEIHQKALALLNKMADHPDSGISFKKMAKQVDGTLNFTDLELAERIQAPLQAELNTAKETLAAIQAEREAEKLAAQQEKQIHTLTGEVDRAAKAFGLTAEGREKMTQRMTEKGNLDADAAAAWVASQAPKAKPSEGNGAFSPALNPFGAAEKDDAVALLHTNPERWQAEEIARILAEEPLSA